MDKSAPIRGGNVQLTALLGDFRLLLILYVSFRLMLMMVYQPIIVNDVERGIIRRRPLLPFPVMALSGQGVAISGLVERVPPVRYLTTTSVFQLFGDQSTILAGHALSPIVLCSTGTPVLSQHWRTASWPQHRHGAGLDLRSNCCAPGVHLVEL
jgi:hypothetical protein